MGAKEVVRVTKRCDQYVGPDRPGEKCPNPATHIVRNYFTKLLPGREDRHYYLCDEAVRTNPFLGAVPIRGKR